MRRRSRGTWPARWPASWREASSSLPGSPPPSTASTDQLRPWVRAVIDPAQPLAVDVGVDLGRRERAVAEELLDGAEVGAALDEVCGEGVAQPMRVRRDPPQRARVEPRSSHRDEERVLRGTDKRRPRLAQVAREPVRGLLAERHDPLLAALPAYVERLLLEVDVGEVEVDRLAAAEAGRVDELDERAVPERQRLGAVQCVEARLDLIGPRRDRPGAPRGPGGGGGGGPPPPPRRGGG